MIVYASRTNNVKSVSKKLEASDILCVDIKSTENVTTPFFIFTYTDKIGEAPEHVLDFLYLNEEFLKGVIASGNVNFGASFCLSADKISKEFNVPIIKKLDLRGSSNDLKDIINSYNKIILSKG